MATEVGLISQMSRSLLTAVQGSASPDPLDDPRVTVIMDEIRGRLAGASVLRMLGATVLFARDELSHTVQKTSAPLSLAEMERAMVEDATIDPSLLRDVFSVVASLESGRDSEILRSERAQVMRVWGPFALLTTVYVVLRIVNTISERQLNVSADLVLQQWALADELNLAALQTNPDPDVFPMPENEESD